MNLTKLNWPAGWTPSADPVNGDPSGLLRMDNLQQDETGATTLVRGLEQLATFSDYVDNLYAKSFNAKECTYAALNINSSQILRSADGSFDDTVQIGTGNGQSAFGDALGQVLICAGTTRLKDNGVTTLPLGLLTPAPPSVGAASQPVLAFFPGQSAFGVTEVSAVGSFTVLTGTLNSGSTNTTTAELIVDETTNIGVVIYNLGAPVDTTQIPTFAADNPDNDTIEFYIAPANPESIGSIKVDFVMNDPTVSFPVNQSRTPLPNLYTYTWDGSVLNQGESAQTTLSINRGSFIRIGTNPNLSWKNIIGIRYTVTATFYTYVDIGTMQIVGGAQGQLNGTYQYVQVNVNDNGQYVAKSPMSQPTQPIWVINGSVGITAAPGDSQTTACWIFRISATQQIGPNGAATSQTTFLNNYYFVGSVAPGQSFVDNQSDDYIIEVDIVANPFLQTLASGDPNSLADNPYYICGLFKSRMLYVGLGTIYLSDDLNPDAIDIRFSIKAFGDPSEKNLWLKKVNNNVMVLGTTKDLYEITGTLEVLPDGTVDVTITPIGESYPPLSTEAAVVNGGIYYVAADGLRVTQGSTSIPFSQQLRLLFQGEPRAGVPPVTIVAGNEAIYSITAGKTKLYISVPTSDGARRLIVFDTVTNLFTLRYTDPITIYATPTDRVLLGYGQESTNPNTPFGSVYLLDSGAGITDQQGHLLAGFPFTLQTVYDSNGQPRNRKDTFTLKLIMDTGGSPVNVFIDLDNKGVWTQLVNQQGQSTTSCNGLTTNYYPLNNVTLGFRYGLKITDTNLVTTFRLYEYTIEYEPRPEQVDYLRLLPTNMDSYARKRWTSFAYVIDTLGNSITFQPFVDNVATGSPDTVVTATKLTHITYFLAETIGTDMGGIFSGGVFEFYGVNLQETVSEKLPTPTEYLVIPPNDFGTPNRKRHTSYKFQIITRGQPVQFTPLLDGQTYSPRTYNTPRKQTVEYFFDIASGDVIGIDIGGTLQSLSVPPTPFEFYGVVVPQQVETLPPRLETYRIPNSNFGSAARKRVRTLPVVIDTYGQDVLFTPIVDGVLLTTTTTFNTRGKTTTYHFFINDVFGTDFGGFLQSAASSPSPFEFYELGQPENVEILPVPKLLDQVGPVRFDKIGKLFTLRTRLISMGDSGIQMSIFADPQTLPYPFSYNFPSGAPVPIFQDVIPVVPYTDQIWEYKFPKNVNLSMCRVVLGPQTNEFHRYDMQLRVSQSGMESDSRWIPAR